MASYNKEARYTEGPMGFEENACYGAKASSSGQEAQFGFGQEENLKFGLKQGRILRSEAFAKHVYWSELPSFVVTILLTASLHSLRLLQLQKEHFVTCTISSSSSTKTFCGFPSFVYEATELASGVVLGHLGRYNLLKLIVIAYFSLGLYIWYRPLQWRLNTVSQLKITWSFAYFLANVAAVAFLSPSNIQWVRAFHYCTARLRLASLFIDWKRALAVRQVHLYFNLVSLSAQAAIGVFEFILCQALNLCVDFFFLDKVSVRLQDWVTSFSVIFAIPTVLLIMSRTVNHFKFPKRGLRNKILKPELTTVSEAVFSTQCKNGYCTFRAKPSEPRTSSPQHVEKACGNIHGQEVKLTSPHFQQGALDSLPEKSNENENESSMVNAETFPERRMSIAEDGILSSEALRHLQDIVTVRARNGESQDKAGEGTSFDKRQVTSARDLFAGVKSGLTSYSGKTSHLCFRIKLKDYRGDPKMLQRALIAAIGRKGRQVAVVTVRNDGLGSTLHKEIEEWS